VDGGSDVAIRMGNLPASALIARKLGESRRVICTAPALERKGVPQKPDSLRDRECLAFNLRRSGMIVPIQRPHSRAARVRQCVRQQRRDDAVDGTRASPMAEIRRRARG
jgi:hypothetical protein